MAKIQSIDQCPPFPLVEGVEFRHAIGFVGYAVDSNGNPWSCLGLYKSRRGWCRLSAEPNGDGYRQVALAKNGRKITTKVATLVAEAFHGPRPEGLLVCHDDGSRDNDVPGNLYWGTHSENTSDMDRHGTRPDLKGEKAPSAKLTREQVREIRSRYPAETAVAISRDYPVSASTVRNIVNRKKWRWLL